MSWKFSDALAKLIKRNQQSLLTRGLHGIERETLRTNPDGTLALSPHPRSLSDPLTDPQITTDFSESQLELITAPHAEISDTIKELEIIHRRVAKNLKNEYMWPFSVPCALPADGEIPIARYGNSPEGKRKEIYRLGLANRYGRYMQTLCGVHYNFNFPSELLEFLRNNFAPEKNEKDFINETYLGVIRTFIKWRWILVYLFGASPFCHKSYRCKAMKKKNKAVSLRLSRCGYSNPAKINISYNSYKRHLTDIQTAIDTVYEPYSRIGIIRPLLKNDEIQGNKEPLHEAYAAIRRESGHEVDTVNRVFQLRNLLKNDEIQGNKEPLQEAYAAIRRESGHEVDTGNRVFQQVPRNGEQIQLNDHLLQDPAEYYFPIRLKPAFRTGNTLTDLQNGGVKYLEVRILDVNAMEPLGISLEQMRFIHVFLNACLFRQTKVIGRPLLARTTLKQEEIALSGRVLNNNDIHEAGKIFQILGRIATAMDSGKVGYSAIVEKYKLQLMNPTMLPWKIIADESGPDDFLSYGIKKAKLYKKYLTNE